MQSDIEALKLELAKSDIKGIALDIDETLSWTIGWWVENLQELFGNPENLSIPELIKKYRYTQNVPYWQTDEALKWMEEHRSSNAVQEQLPLIPDVHQYVLKIHKIVPVIAYITVRPDSVIQGTKNWLAKHNFPEAPVIARPESVDHTAGNEWKAEALNYLYPSVLGIVDDNPSLVQQLPESYKGTVFVYENEPPLREGLDIVHCRDWLSVVEAVEKRFGK